MQLRPLARPLSVAGDAFFKGDVVTGEQQPDSPPSDSRGLSREGSTSATAAYGPSTDAEAAPQARHAHDPRSKEALEYLESLGRSRSPAALVATESGTDRQGRSR